MSPYTIDGIDPRMDDVDDTEEIEMTRWKGTKQKTARAESGC